MLHPIFSIQISTKNRKKELAFTLSKIQYLINDSQVELIVFDDGSTDGTYEYVSSHFPQVKIQRNTISKGYLFCRNTMLNATTAAFAISLDDDAHFVIENPLEFIVNHFSENSNCGLLALRIFWGLEEPEIIESSEIVHSVKGFVGCAHVWRMQAWREIPNYPEWFVFYGEEDFASHQLFKQGWAIHYFPKVLVNHRVDIKSRKNNADYVVRLRRSLRSGWYLFFLFYPIRTIPKKMAYSVWMQFKLKVFKGDFKVLKAICLASIDLVCSVPTILKNSNRLTQEEYDAYQKLPETKIYWQHKKGS